MRQQNQFDTESENFKLRYLDLIHELLDEYLLDVKRVNREEIEYFFEKFFNIVKKLYFEDLLEATRTQNNADTQLIYDNLKQQILARIYYINKFFKAPSSMVMSKKMIKDKIRDIIYGERTTINYQRQVQTRQQKRLQNAGKPSGGYFGYGLF